MSLNVCIADDEYFIRQRIKKLIPWSSMNLTFIGEAENGEQVLQYLHNQKIDILLLDIKMPKLNGLEVAQYIQKHFPATHIIILSGYNDFDFAQSAIRAGVKEYLLKPIVEDDLIHAISSCIHSITEHANTRQRLEMYERYELIHQLSDVRNGLQTFTSLCQTYPIFQRFSHSIYCSIYSDKSPSMTTSTLAEKLRENGYHCEYTQESECVYILQIFVKDPKAFSRIGSIFTSFLNLQKNYVFLYLDEVFPIQMPWLPYYQRTLHLNNERYFSKQSNLCIRYEHSEPPKFKEEMIAIRKKLISILNSGEIDMLKEYLDEIFQSVCTKKSCDYLCLVFIEIFTTYHIYFHIPKHLSQSISEFASTLLATEFSLDSLKDEALFYGLECIQKIDAIPSEVALCKKISDYVEQNFQDPSLSVSQIAEHFGMSVSYLGSIYKKVNHLSIIQSITNIRIEHAQRLLKEGNLKITEIAESSGYSDVYYFSKKFKKTCGCSPKTYANTYQDSL